MESLNITLAISLIVISFENLIFVMRYYKLQKKCKQLEERLDKQNDINLLIYRTALAGGNKDEK